MTTSRPPASTTCWPCPARTSRSWRWACSGWPGCSGSRGSPPRSRRSPRSPPTSSRSAGSRRSCAPALQAASRRLPGCSPDPRDRWHFLALGAAVLLAWTPASLLEPGFQLSFAAVGSIFLLLPRLRLALEGYPLPNWLREALAVSTACGAATAPILWLQFGSVPVYSLPANALVTPAIGPLLGIALVGSPARAGAADRRARARLAERLAGRVHRRLRARDRRACRSLRSAPPRPSACCSGRRSRCSPCTGCRGGGDRWRSRARRRSLPALLAWQLLPGARLPPPTGLRITFLDVGQGDSILLQVPEGAVLVDQGPPEADVARQLRGLGVRHLAAIVLTHPQRDHVGGAEDILRRLAVDRVLDPRLAVSGPFERAALAEAADRRRAGRRDARGRRLSARPPPAPRALAGQRRNGEREPEPARDRPPRELRRGRRAVDGRRRDGRDGAPAVAPGSRSSRSRTTARPIPGSRTSCASCGRPWRSSPAAATTTTAIRRRPRWPRSATAQGCSLYRTDEDGRVVLESDGRRISVRSER